MTLRDIKSWINNLPDEFLDFETVSSEEGKIPDTDNTYRKDSSIVALDIDEESKEVLLMTKVLDR